MILKSALQLQELLCNELKLYLRLKVGLNHNSTTVVGDVNAPSGK